MGVPEHTKRRYKAFCFVLRSTWMIPQGNKFRIRVGDISTVGQRKSWVLAVGLVVITVATVGHVPLRIV